MRRYLMLGAVVVAAVAPVLADDDKAQEDYKAIEQWLDQQKPKTAEDRRVLRVELTKKLRAFLKAHPDATKTAHAAKSVLADVLIQDSKFDDALAIWEELLKSGDEDMAPRARHGLVKTYIAKKDLAKARARLDEFMKAHPDEKTLGELDAYLKQLEAGKHLKVGSPAPPLKGKGVDGKEVDLASFKGKVVLLDFWATWCPPCKKDLPILKKLYGDQHAKGFEIVGVDGVEKDYAAFKKFLEKEQVTWPQITARDGQTISRTYGVEELPRTVLVGKDGLVVALDLRGEDLAAAVRAAVEGKPIPAGKAIGPGGTPKPSGDE